MSLPIPDKVWDAHVAILAKTGAGKSYLVQLVTEAHLAVGERVCLIDPMDRYWGLRMTAKGKPSPYDITIVGGDRGDLALKADHGRALAEIVGKSATNMIISTRKLTKDQRSQFAADFFEHLLAVNQGILHLTIDECHLFAPQQGMKAGGFTPKMLSATQEIASGGRGVGLCMNFVSQRPAKLHNDVLSCAETLIAMRMLLPHDVEQVQNWIKHWATLEQGKEVLKSLGRLKTGEAWVWAPEMEILKRIEVPRISTFDSGAPGAAQSAPQLNPMDLDAITAKLKTAGENILADDPRALKAEIAKLKREAAAQPAPGASQAELDAAHGLGFLQGEAEGRKAGFLEARDQVAGRLRDAIVEIRDLVAPEGSAPTGPHAAFERAKAAAPIGSAGPMVPVRNARPAPAAPPRMIAGPGSKLAKAERAILTVLAQYPQGRTKTQIAILCGYAHNSGSFSNSLGSNRTAGRLEGENNAVMRITDTGLVDLGSYDPLPTGRALLDHWLGQLGKAEAACLTAIAAAYPARRTKEEVAADTSYAADSGSFSNALGKLRTLELIEGSNSSMRANDDLFG